MPVINRLKELRAERNLSQEDLAEGAGFSVETVRALEQGKNQEPKISFALACAAFFGVAVEDIFFADSSIAMLDKSLASALEQQEQPV